MKTLTTITAAVIALGLLTTILFAGHYSTNCLQLVWVPYVILFALMLIVEAKSSTAPSKIAVLITASLISIMSAQAYYEVSYSTSHKSTEALAFFIVPLFSIVLIPIIYLATKLLVRLIIPAREITE
jgi:hypothetical protein